MKIVLDIPDSKADFMLELIHSLQFVKAEFPDSTDSDKKLLFLKELDESVNDPKEELSGGRVGSRDAYEFLDELQHPNSSLF
jgi:hypothetical protein